MRSTVRRSSVSRSNDEINAGRSWLITWMSGERPLRHWPLDMSRRKGIAVGLIENRDHGLAGRVDRSTRPKPCPHRVSDQNLTRRTAWLRILHHYNHHQGHTALKGHPPPRGYPTYPGHTSSALHGFVHTIASELANIPEPFSEVP